VTKSGSDTGHTGEKWEDVDDIGGVVMPLSEALEFIANEGIFWLWT